MEEIKEDNEFFHKAIEGDDDLGYPGLMKRTNRMKENQNDIIRNQRRMHDRLTEYGVVDGDMVHPDEVNGPNPRVEDLEYGN